MLHPLDRYDATMTDSIDAIRFSLRDKLRSYDRQYVIEQDRRPHTRLQERQHNLPKTTCLINKVDERPKPRHKHNKSHAALLVNDFNCPVFTHIAPLYLTVGSITP